MSMEVVTSMASCVRPSRTSTRHHTFRYHGSQAICYSLYASCAPQRRTRQCPNAIFHHDLDQIEGAGLGRF